MESKYSRMHFNKCISINGYIIFTVERIMTDNQSDPVIQRLDRLERENWYWKRATILLLIVIGSVILMAVSSPSVVNPLIQAQTIEAQEFVIKDANGKIRAELKYDEGMK